MTWLPQSSFGDAQERRIALEFDTGALHREYLVTDAHLAFFPSNISGGPRTLQLHGYAGNGAVEVQDMTADHLVTSFVAATTAPVSLDVKAFMQAAADQQYLFAGFLLRLELIKPADDLFNLGVSMSNNMDRNVVPRLSIVYCVDANHDLKCD